MTPRFVRNNTYLLVNERGVTLIETLITVVILAVMIITIYIGIQYAEKQTVQNYRHRAASLLASGEIERQYFRCRFDPDQTVMTFMPFNNREVVIDVLKNGESLLGTQSLTVGQDSEFQGSQTYKFYYLTSTVEWLDPDTKKTHKVVMREDFF